MANAHVNAMVKNSCFFPVLLTAVIVIAAESEAKEEMQRNEKKKKSSEEEPKAMEKNENTEMIERKYSRALQLW